VGARVAEDVYRDSSLMSAIGGTAGHIDHGKTSLVKALTVVRVAPDLYFLAEALAGVKSAIRDCLLKQNELTPARFRDLFGTSRKYTIPLLEYLDREGITIRVGDVRRLKGQAVRAP
jgi:Elongation factor SelB, winged helix